MECYVEISFLHNMATIVLSVLMGEYASMQPIAIKKAIIYAIVLSAAGCFFWFAYAWIVLLLLELLCFGLFFRYAYKTYFAQIVIRVLWNITAFIFYQGGFHNGMWFAAASDNVMALWFVYGCIFVLLAVKWKDTFARLNYVYDANILLQDGKLRVKSYLDSGNLLTYESVPILFIDKKYQSYFKKQRIELVVMSGINTSDVIRCYACKLKLAGCREQAVYVHCDRHLQLPFHCDVLLNVNVMTMG